MKDIEIAAYIDRGLKGAQLDRIEEHLAACTHCRESVAHAQQIVARTRRPQRLLRQGLILAAAAGVVLVARPAIESANRDAAPTVRDDGTTPKLLALGPIGGVAPPVRFVWGSATGALSYRLTISTSDGVAVWSTSTIDTTAALPGSVNLKDGVSYTWVVDALLNDGSTRSTGLHEFGLNQ